MLKSSLQYTPFWQILVWFIQFLFLLLSMTILFIKTLTYISSKMIKNNIQLHITQESPPKKKLQKFGHMSKVALPYLPIPPGMDKVQFGHKFFCLPYLPIQLVWTFWNQNLFLEKVSKTFRQGGSLIFMGVQGLFSIFRGGLYNLQKFKGGQRSFQEFLGEILEFCILL